MSFADLLHLFPEQSFRFVELNVQNETIMEVERLILRCIQVEVVSGSSVARANANGLPDRLLLLADIEGRGTCVVRRKHKGEDTFGLRS